MEIHLWILKFILTSLIARDHKSGGVSNKFRDKFKEVLITVNIAEVSLGQ